MILFTLRCSADHRFQGWFRDGAACEAQLAGQIVECPTCGDHAVTKAPMAPHIARSSAKASELTKPADTAVDSTVNPAPHSISQSLPEPLRQQLRALRQQVESQCDYVGDQFAEQARRIHYGESDARPIYGETTPGEAAQLADEGVPFARIPWLPRHDA